ncbi:MAG TPA: serine/threonine-protein kinase, partial [Nannocystaceae bacterium]|nr:serine/threonine-protein kinase [Nannocystaceae bacterium]
MADREDGPTTRATEPREPADSDPGSSSGGLESRVLLARARVRLLGRSPEPVHVGRYRILSRLGQGGMGVVYLAHDDELDRRVAIKILRHDLAPSSAGRSRLLREAQATARLSHPNVVHVYEVGHEADQVYMAMEYIEGETLRRWCDGKPRSCAELVAIFSAAGEALAAAHEAGLVHRDFKPDNVLVGRDGRPRVVDFGLARADEATTTMSGREPTAKHSPIDVTATATLAGTPAYMAPEQHARQGADPRSDQFAFCVSLFEALYRKRPFGGETLTELAVQVAEGAIATVDPVAAGVPMRVHAAVMRGLSRHARQRFATMRELLAELREAAAPRARRAWWPFAAIGAGALAVAAL